MNGLFWFSREFLVTVKFTIFLSVILFLGSRFEAIGQVIDTPQSRMRPIGSPSRVDHPQRHWVSPRETSLHETAHHHRSSSAFSTNSVRQTAMQFALPQEMGSLGPAP